VLRRRGERHVEARRELADRFFTTSEPRQDLPPYWMRERGKGCIEARLMVNHVVYY
jgi:hypothetical protein